MATVKIKFRPSAVDGKPGTVFYQVIHHRTARQQKTVYRLYACEWDDRLQQVLLPPPGEHRRAYLEDIGECIRRDVCHLQRIIADLELGNAPYTAADVLAEFSTRCNLPTLFCFMEETIAGLMSWGKVRTAETYAAALASFRRFRQGRDVPLDELDSRLVTAYEAYLKACGLCANTSSFYLRNLRAVYNRAVEQGLTAQRCPFKHVYTGVDRTVKRAVPLEAIRRLKEMDLSATPALCWARDMFLFSFYTRGMSFVDMAYLRKRDLNGGSLIYRRRKTGQPLCIRWEPEMQGLVDKYPAVQSPYLLPIIRSSVGTAERKQYLYAAHNINRSLKIIGLRLGLSLPLTLYVARHAWASIAKSKNVPLSVISEGMGHDSEATTRIYLASLDTGTIDRANRMILKSL